jgi:hypothetical protein
LADDPPRFLLLEREVEIEYRPQMLAALQSKVDAFAVTARPTAPVCPRCGQAMRRQDTREVSWLARCGCLHAPVSRYRCRPCRYECRPLLDLLGVEPGRISGALARLLALLATVAPYPLAARWAWLLLGVTISPLGIWRVAQRLGEAAAHHTDALSRYHADSRSIGAPTQAAPSTVVLGVNGCNLGMQVRSTRRRRKAGETLPPLPPVEEGRFREVKTGVLLLPSERVETSPGRRSVVRRFLVTCLGDADAIFASLYAQLRELGWVGAHTVVVIAVDGAEWIWKRASMFVRRCEILDFWHAIEHAWEFAQLRYGEGSAQADRWVHAIAEALRAGKVQEVIARLKRCGRKHRSCARACKRSSVTPVRMPGACAMTSICDWAMGSAVAPWSAHKQVVHARFRQAGMRWSEAGARRLLALRLLLWNDNWALLDRLRMVSLA